MQTRSSFYYFIVLLLIGVLLLLLNTLPGIRVFKNIVARLLFSSSVVIDYPIQKSGKIYNQAKRLLNLYWENERLNQEIFKLKSQYRDTEYVSNRNKRLEELLHFSSELPGKLIPAQVVVNLPEQYFTTFNIDIGKKHNIQTDWPVVVAWESKWVLVGRIKEIFDDFSRVTLVTSPDFRCGAELERGYRGVIKGTNGWSLRFKYLSPDAEVAAGDPVYTSGTGGIFPEGLFIGNVSKIEALEFSQGKEAIVKPCRFPQNAKFVYVLRK